MKKIVICGGSVIGGLLGGLDHWYTNKPEIDGGAIILGVLVGALVTKWAWSIAES